MKVGKIASCYNLWMKNEFLQHPRDDCQYRWRKQVEILRAHRSWPLFFINSWSGLWWIWGQSQEHWAWSRDGTRISVMTAKRWLQHQFYVLDHKQRCLSGLSSFTICVYSLLSGKPSLGQYTARACILLLKTSYCPLHLLDIYFPGDLVFQEIVLDRGILLEVVYSAQLNGTNPGFPERPS